MEIAIKNLTYQNCFYNLSVTLHDNHIIGVMGKNYDKLLLLMATESDSILFNNLNLLNKRDNYVAYIGKDLKFFTNVVYDEILLYLNRYPGKIRNINKRIKKILNTLMVSDDILTKEISDLSTGEKKLLKYILILIYNPNVIIIDEPFLYLDFYYKKIINNILYNLKTKYKKTIIIGSRDSNIIYSLCALSLFLGFNKHLYGVTKSIFNDQDLKTYGIVKPNLVAFTDLARGKGINIGYFQDIRDLIKDVYRNV